ncbi:MAG: molecular chaperone HscC [Pseudomonadota bacterium]|nr:molecular chaperone HscC [Pseudomonadota bacterium]
MPVSAAAPAAPVPMIGIDLGTTNSSIAVWEGGQARLIANSLGEVLTPSVVSVDEAGHVLVGRAAEHRRITHPHLTAAVFKRVMGSAKRFRLGPREFAPEELSSLVLTSLKHDAEAALGQPVREAVISVPAYFNDTQRKATKNAAELAGLKVSRLINEPTAAALAFGLHQSRDETRFLVFDLGGGTFDVSIVELFEGVVEVKASTGDNYLGGEDFTQVIAQDMAQQFGLDAARLESDGTLRNRLHAVAERCKQALGTGKSATDQLHLDGQERSCAIDEERFETLASDLLARLRKPIERAMRDSRLKPAALDSIVMVGGASRMPVVRKIVARMFGRFPDTSVHPDHAIALGAAVQAALIAQDAALSEVLMTDVCPYSLGVEVSETIAPNQNLDGLFSPIIERNTVVPASRMGLYHTMHDGQTEIDLKVYQGEQRFVKDNVYLGSLKVKVPPLKGGEINVEVRFSYDVSGLLEVDATVLNTGKKHSLTLLGHASAMSEEEVATRRAELSRLKIHPRDDMPNKLVLTRIERLYAELSGPEREAVGQALTQFTMALNSQDTERIARERKQVSQWLDGLEASPLN